MAVPKSAERRVSILKTPEDGLLFRGGFFPSNARENVAPEQVQTSFRTLGRELAPREERRAVSSGPVKSRRTEWIGSLKRSTFFVRIIASQNGCAPGMRGFSPPPTGSSIVVPELGCEAEPGDASQDGR